ncbi:hypothetical protein GUITHDRAFT_112857 [Guillardia theta CCMP2712]|uniref:PAS domain-containing protein n=2 Tax=Guillardia theta TaxID=55529 RepID=L1IYZ1_GUITC|nr:hypothetical protein GUITHDRAFT_112857 [Guillardia theta CCMP2712]EKX41124.1 hypothetical protein GUITHDRAFT_112857 [Guillardia theta CCMP2712]|eukprot:XP_005828104.1 hypothetical protein GUITHDRAFT_112857 [Guillardia theta CCMP2712]
MFNWTSSELVIGRGCSLMYGPQTDLLKMHEIICGASDKKRPGVQFASLYKSDSSQLFAHIKAKQMTTGDGKFSVLYMMRCDTMHMYQAVSHADVPKAVITASKPGRLVFVNDQFVSTFGFSKKQAERSSIRMIQGPRTNPGTWKNIFKRIQTGFEHEDWVMVYSSDCREIMCHIHAYPVVDGIGRASCVMVMFEVCSDSNPFPIDQDSAIHFRRSEIASSSISSASEDSKRSNCMIGECSNISSSKSPIALSDFETERERQKVRAIYNRTIGVQLQEEVKKMPRTRKLLYDSGDCCRRRGVCDSMTSLKKRKLKSWIQKRRSLQLHVGYKPDMGSLNTFDDGQNHVMDDGKCIFALILEFLWMIYRLIASALGIPIREDEDDDMPHYNECQTKRVFENWIHLG